MSSSTEIIARIAMSLLPGIDVTVATRLLEAFGTASGVIEATETELKTLDWVPRGIVSSQERYQARQKALVEADFIEKSRVKALWFQDVAYSQRLLRAQRAPVMIYTLGDLDLNNGRTVGIVGTRHATGYGTSFTEQLVKDLAESVDNIVTISGLAYGIDIAAHRASLKCNIPTIGIVAHGLTKLYPAAHRDTAARMIRSGGMVLSDYPHDAAVSGYNFLARNRLVAALSDVLVVAESGAQGGALSTARHALKAQVPVFALPGRVTDNYSIGCNRLIADGTARCLTGARDIIDFMRWPVKAAAGIVNEPSVSIIDELNNDERQVLHKIITANGCDSDMLVALTGMTASRIMTLMIGLEMKGIVTMVPGNRYQVLQTIDVSQLLR